MNSVSPLKMIAVYAAGLLPITMAFNKYSKLGAEEKKTFTGSAKVGVTAGITALGVGVFSYLLLKDEINQAAAALPQNEEPAAFSGIRSLGVPLFKQPYSALGWDPTQIGLITATREYVGRPRGCYGC